MYIMYDLKNNEKIIENKVWYMDKYLKIYNLLNFV